MAKAANGKWTWRLDYWIHDTYQGDDMQVTVRFNYKPTEREVEQIMKKGYRRYAVDGCAGVVFENMKSDHSLRQITSKEVQHG
jgi:hypothetical protein